MINRKNQNGVTIIAAIFIIVVLGFMGVMFLTMVNTASLTSVNDLQSTQALYIAEGGVEYEQRNLAQNLDWYRSTSDPFPVTTQNLGLGSFTTSTTLPATMLRRRLLDTENNTITVYTTDRFPNAGTLQIDDDAGLGNGEFVSYTGKTPTTFTGAPLGRGVLYVGGTLGQARTPYGRGTRVYPVAFLSGTNLTNVCATVPTPFQITANTKFLSAGTINVYDRATLVSEEITYTGSSTAGGVTTLTGVQRCQNGTGPPGATANAGDPVTPINVDNPPAAPDYEAEIVSTGTVGSAVRVVKKTVQR